MAGWGGILLLAVIGVGFGVVSVVISRFLGPRNPTPEKLAAYECGMPPVGDARERQSIKFYLIAMIFLLFDIEVAFLYPWALAMRELSWPRTFHFVLFFPDPGRGLHLYLAQGCARLGPRVRSRLQARPETGPRPGEEIPLWDSKLITKFP
jgi:NADH-quinone oxidoreductase subunit A